MSRQHTLVAFRNGPKASSLDAPNRYLACALVLSVTTLVGLRPCEGAETLSVTLFAGDYRVDHDGEGAWRIAMDGFATLPVAGMPELPGRVFDVPLPGGAVVGDVRFLGVDFQSVVVSGEPARVSPGIHVRSLEDGTFESTVLEPDEDGPLSGVIPDDPEAVYPAEVASYLGQGTSGDTSHARIRFHPFRYDPVTGRVERTASLQVEMDNELLEENEQADQIRDVVDLSDLRVRADYIVVAANDAIRSALADFKAWKEELGHRVEIVTVAEITTAASGIDDAERIYNFLRSSYQTYHALKYVLLAGDIDRIPMRLLYPDNKDWPYVSDYYYAKLTIPTWDKDGDKRWGEFVDDDFDPAPDVYVGRLPFNDVTLIEDIAGRTIAFEQDTSSWKHDALLPYGMFDPWTDGAKVGKHVIADILRPQGWGVTKLYEKAGIQPSPAVADLPLSAPNVVAALTADHYGVLSLLAHGGSGGMASQHWAQDKNHDNQVSGDELGWTWFSRTADITAAGDIPSIVMLAGCSTSVPVAGDSPFSMVSNDAAGSEQLLLTPRTNHIGKEYLRRGAVAVIGGTAGADYGRGWSTPADGRAQSLTYYFLDELIRRRKSVGAALYDALHRYDNQHRAARGIRVYHLQGDPSLRLDGFERRPGGADALVHSGKHHAFSADSANDGTLYAAVLTSAQNESGVVRIYCSSDHGDSWFLWYTLKDSAPILDVSVLVSEWSGEFTDARVHVFTSTTEGRVQVHRIDRTTRQADRRVIANVGAGVRIDRIAVSRTAVAATPMLYIAYHYLDARTGDHGVMIARSTNQGVNWGNWHHFGDMLDPSIEAGPSGRVHVVARKTFGGYFDDVLRVATSTDRGVSFGAWTDLTSGVPGCSHGWSTPVVAASSDPAVPTVWVAYSTFCTDSTSAELHFAYSEDGGVNWSSDRGLSGGPAAEALVDLRAFKAQPSRWINTAYLRNPASPRVIWRYSTGSLPEYWSPERLENDYPATESKAEPPRILYSPGAPATGSGVLYATRDSIRFSASWLVGPSIARVDLGESDLESGLINNFRFEGTDGNNEVVYAGPDDDRRDARKNWLFDDPDDEISDTYFYFGVIDPKLKTQSDLQIEAVVHDDPDAAGARVALQYTNERATDPADLDNVFSDHPTQYSLAGTGEWKTLTWNVQDAGFRNFMRGTSDFRLVTDGRISVDEVRIRDHRLGVGFSGERVFGPDPSPSTLTDEIIVEVPEGEKGRAVVYVNISSRVADYGVRGWSLGVGLKGEAHLLSAGTENTAAAPYPDGLRRDGMDWSQIIDPAENSGRRGVVTAAVLGVEEFATLPRVCTASVLRLVVESDRPLGNEEEQVARLHLMDGLVGSGKAVENVLTVRHFSERPRNLEDTEVTLRFVARASHPPFSRGDANADGRRDITDALVILGYLFLGDPRELGCEKSADLDDDGRLEIDDPLGLLYHLFPGTFTPRAPFPRCGLDPSVDDLSCVRHPPCE